MEDEAVFHLGGSVDHTAFRERFRERSLRTCRDLLELLRGRRTGDAVAMNCVNVPALEFAWLSSRELRKNHGRQRGAPGADVGYPDLLNQMHIFFTFSSLFVRCSKVMHAH
jgi:hypothetical protein